MKNITDSILSKLYSRYTNVQYRYIDVSEHRNKLVLIGVEFDSEVVIMFWNIYANSIPFRKLVHEHVLLPIYNKVN